MTDEVEDEALLKVLFECRGRAWILKKLKTFPKNPPPGRPSVRNATIADWLIKRQREIDQKALEAIRAGKAKTKEEVEKLRRPPLLIEAVKAVMPGASKEELKKARSRFDGFSFDDPARGFGRGKWYK